MFRVLVLVFFCMVGADMIVSLYKYKKRRASIYSVYCTMGVVCSVLLMVIPILLKSTFGFSFVFFSDGYGKNNWSYSYRDYVIHHIISCL